MATIVFCIGILLSLGILMGLMDLKMSPISKNQVLGLFLTQNEIETTCNTEAKKTDNELKNYLKNHGVGYIGGFSPEMVYRNCIKSFSFN